MYGEPVAFTGSLAGGDTVDAWVTLYSAIPAFPAKLTIASGYSSHPAAGDAGLSAYCYAPLRVIIDHLVTLLSLCHLFFGAPR